MATLNVEKELAALRHMAGRELRDKYLEVFGEEPRSRNRVWLTKRIIWRMQALAEGHLSERARLRAAELANDADLRCYARRPPAPDTAAPVAITPTLAIPLPSSGLPMPGTILTRKYKGQLVQVTVLRDGFEHEGEVYKSLSAVAKKVTGSHWNGHLFFGLRGDA